MLRILSVSSSSPAAGAGIRPGEGILSINGEKVIDEIDYQDLITGVHLEMEIIGTDGRIRPVTVAKSSWEPLGLQLDETIALKPRQCMNHCVFCFIDQMPPGMRDTLYVKDDDWRLSLMMGNFVTLTNVNEQEFIRILRRRASPLYISVHATDPEIRKRMLKNPNAGNILERLTALKNHGLQFHAQIVLCPGLNDGTVLQKSLDDLSALWPSALSVAIVPVGVTKYRDNLEHLTLVTQESAEELIRSIETYQNRCLSKIGTRFVFLSDEFYCLCGKEPPEELSYEDYPQIENGVGLVRRFMEECAEAYRDLEQEIRNDNRSHPETRVAIPTGVSVKPYIEELCRLYAPEWVHTEVIPVANRFFGETITVTGLIVGQDLVRTLEGKDFDTVMISESMLRENTECFLDDMTLGQVREIIGKPIRVNGNTGESFIRALYQMEEKDE